MPWPVLKSSSRESWKTQQLPCLSIRNGCWAEVIMLDPHLSYAARACAQPHTDPDQLPSLIWGTSSSLWSCLLNWTVDGHRLLSLDLPWPRLSGLCSQLHLRPASSPQTSLTSSLMFVWFLLLSESPDLPCLGPVQQGPGWRVPCSARLIVTGCPWLPTLEGQPSLAGADSSAGTGSTDRITTKYKVWHHVRALQSWKENPRASC